jgi:hypothetical protein
VKFRRQNGKKLPSKRKIASVFGKHGMGTIQDRRKTAVLDAFGRGFRPLRCLRQQQNQDLHGKSVVFKR